MKKATSKNTVITESQAIIAESFSGIRLINIGTDDATVNDNIPLKAGTSFVWENHPGVVIDENISIRFKDVDADKQVLVIKFFIKED